MLKSLLWKEWRLNKAVVYGAILVFLGWIGLAWLGIWLQYGRFSLGYPGPNDWLVAEGGIRVFGYYVLCSIIACGIAATSFADEKGKKTIEFLFIQPLSRTKIWFIKVLFGLVLIAMVFLVFMIIHRLAGFPWAFSQNIFMGDVNSQVKSQFIPYLPHSLYMILLMYALTLFFSTILDNTAVTVLAGATGNLIIYFGLGFIGGIYCWQFDWHDALRLFLPLSVIFLTLSHLIFCRADYWDKSTRKKWHNQVALIAIPLFLVSFIPYMVGIYAFYPKEIETINLIGVNQQNQQVIFSVKEKSGESRIWEVGARHTLPAKQISGRGCDNPIISTQGDKLAVISDRNSFGFRRGDRQIRIWIMNPDGTNKQCLPTKDIGFGHDIAAGVPALIWSPDGTKLAYRKTVFLNKKRNKAEDRLCIFNLKTSKERIVPVPEKNNTGWYLKSWFADNRSLYIGYPSQTNAVSPFNSPIGICYRIRQDGKILDKHYHSGSNQGECSSPDGKWQAYSVIDNNTTKLPTEALAKAGWHIPLVLENLETGKTISVTTSNRFGKLFWSPDSKNLAFIETDETYTPASTKNNFKRLPGKTVEQNIAYIISSTRHNLRIIPLQENAKSKLIGNTVSFKPAWSPDSRYIVFIGIQKISELREEAATAIYDLETNKSWFVSSPNYKDWISVPTSRFKGGTRVIAMINPTVYIDLIWINNETMAYTVALGSGDETQPNTILYSMKIDGKERKQIFP
jgi:Tol biopolymer transport system component/ABC-type transport system involved in multi-copper enzyme maturation permease subunit